MVVDTKGCLINWCDNLDEFKKAFEKEFLGLDILYVQAQEYLNQRQEHIMVEEFSIGLNALA